MRTCTWHFPCTVLECNHCTSELVEVVLSALSVFATEDRCGLAPLWAHLPLIIATPVTAPILVAALDALLDMPLSPDVAPPLPPPPHSSRTSPRTSDNLSGTLTNACKTIVRVRVGPRRGSACDFLQRSFTNLRSREDLGDGGRIRDRFLPLLHLQVENFCSLKTRRMPDANHSPS